jgi:two-component system, OmpR family, phosphate regulon sensor histidine kinase PhoR
VEPSAGLLAVVAAGAIVVALVALRSVRDRERRLREALGAATGTDAAQTAERLRREHRESIESSTVATRELGDLRELLDALPLAVLRLDGAARVRSANRAATDLLADRGRLVGRTAMEVFTDHRVDEVLAAAATRGARGVELPAGAEGRPVLFVRCLRASDGWWLILEDVTEVRRLQRIRTEFVDNLSHELRTPLTTIRLLTETIVADAQAPGVPERLRERVHKIDVESGHLVQMVNELLDLSRIEQGSVPLAFEDLDLRSVAAASIDRLRTFAERQGVRLELAVPADLPPLRGDAERVGQLLLNLLHNAVKFSASGDQVRVSARADDREVVISVEDEGVGIPRSELGRVFERFYKVDRARVRAGGGTGLGLSIARHIAESHGGRIWVESDEGAGSTFHVALPLAPPLPPVAVSTP